MADTPSRILVIDDNPQNRRLMEALLVPHGYDVVGVPSGPDGLAWVP